MTNSQAIKKAENMWGTWSEISFRCAARGMEVPPNKPVYIVRTIGSGIDGKTHYGQGGSWESAFADAERRAKENGK